MSKPARPKRSVPKQVGAAAKPDRTAAKPAAANLVMVATPDSGDGAKDQSAVAFSAKRRCQGATRYGQPCRLWATAGGDFCYWCERAGRPRYPVAGPTGEAASAAGTACVRKQRCRGLTVFGEPCGCFSAGDVGLCLWCQGAEKRGKHTLAR